MRLYSAVMNSPYHNNEVRISAAVNTTTALTSTSLGGNLDIGIDHTAVWWWVVVRQGRRLVTDSAEVVVVIASHGAGDLMGFFKLGSTVVLIFEAPATLHFNMNPGDSVQLGQDIAQVTTASKISRR